MSAFPSVLITGASGYLGQHLVEGLAPRFRIRALDVRACAEPAEWIEGSVSDPASVERALCGMDALLISHMAPNRPGVYEEVELPFDVNVKGTALLLHAAAKAGIKRVVLISSIGVFGRDRINDGAQLTADTRFSPDGIYGLTKCLQEEIARFHHDRHGLSIAVLRPAYVIREDSLQDKYGRQSSTVNWQYIDPRDIAMASGCALRAENLGFEVFYVLGGPNAAAHADLTKNEARLGWRPKHCFEKWPVAI